MSEIKIVEYDHSYANAVSEMWSRSSEGWNGNDMGRTPETVIREHDNAFHLHVFLAVRDREVIGYLSFDQYTLDEGALYVNTLNVRTDCHGQKIGKMLVLHAVEKTVELGWPRLDLFTWPGNTKAVPLYKKCGFFWEKRDDTTHLMNFIPTVLKTEAIQDFFKEADWYNDSVRSIEIKPDGRRENKFDYLEYAWRHNGRTLRVEFERTGRGMRLVETEDYRISASVERHELVFGMHYKVSYEAVNKTGEPLHVSIKGMDDKNISFDFASSFMVTDQTTVDGSFFVGEVREDQNPNKTHPAVTAEILVNGRKVLFRIGIIPVYPAKMTLHVPGTYCHVGLMSDCQLEVQNMFPVAASFSFAPENQEGIDFGGKSYGLHLGPGERKTVALSYKLDDHAYYSRPLRITAHPENSDIVVFEKRLDVPFRGISGIIHGESEELCEIINGPYHARLYKQNNSLHVGRAEGESMSWNFPRIGRPFTAELSRKPPRNVEFFREENTAGFKAAYDFEAFPDIILTMVCKLGPSGILQRHFLVENTSGTMTPEPVYLSDTFNFNILRAVFPYNGNIVEMGDSVTGWINNWDSDKITENWLFSQGMRMTRGICWEEGNKIRFDVWNMFFEHDLGQLGPFACVSTGPVSLALGTFGCWQDFRTYVLKKTRVERPEPVRSLEFSVNGGSAFLPERFNVSIMEHRNQNHEIRFRLRSARQAFDETTAAHKKEASLEIVRKPFVGYDTLTLSYESENYSLSQTKGVFYTNGKDVRTGTETEKGKTVLWADNGTIMIKASPDFSYDLFSLSCQGEEWLDTSFPEPVSKAWWNPWTGGIHFSISKLSTSSLLQEKRSTSHTTVRDRLGNLWQGIKMSIAIEENELYKGMGVDLYYLMLPGAPVVCFLAGIRQDTGRYLKENGFYTECFFKAGEDLGKCTVSFENMDQETVTLKAGSEQYFMTSLTPVMFGSPERENKLLVHTNPGATNLEAGVMNNLAMVETTCRKDIKDGERIFLQPVYFIISREYIQAGELQDLIRLGFDEKEFLK
ncbi:MAG: GNAT family N-acetyltransferase [Clostridia bacterium]